MICALTIGDPSADGFRPVSHGDAVSAQRFTAIATNGQGRSAR